MGSDRVVRKQSAVIPYRKHKGNLEILLITSIKTGRWVIPKGGIENYLTARRSAEKEAFEEAGITGSVGHKCLGEYLYVKSENKNGDECHVKVFPMSVRKELENWPEKKLRKRKWVKAKDALPFIAEKKLREIISDFARSAS